MFYYCLKIHSFLTVHIFYRLTLSSFLSLGMDGCSLPRAFYRGGGGGGSGSGGGDVAGVTPEAADTVGFSAVSVFFIQGILKV